MNFIQNNKVFFLGSVIALGQCYFQKTCQMKYVLVLIVLGFFLIYHPSIKEAFQIKPKAEAEEEEAEEAEEEAEEAEDMDFLIDEKDKTPRHSPPTPPPKNNSDGHDGDNLKNIIEDAFKLPKELQKNVDHLKNKFKESFKFKKKKTFNEKMSNKKRGMKPKLKEHLTKKRKPKKVVERFMNFDAPLTQTNHQRNAFMTLLHAKMN